MFRLQPGPSDVRDRLTLQVLFARGEDAAVIQSTAPCCRSGNAVPRTPTAACTAAAIPASGTAPCDPAIVTARAPAAITVGVVVVTITVTFQPATSFPFLPSRARVGTIAMRIFHCWRASSILGSSRRTVHSATLGPSCGSWRLQLIFIARLLRWVIDITVSYAG